MTYKMKGKVHLKGQIKKVSDNFSKLDLVLIDDSGKFPQYVSFELANKVAETSSNIKAGDEVSITFAVRGRHWKDDKYFNTLSILSIEPVVKSNGNSEKQSDADSAYDNYEEVPTPNDDLPF